MKNISLFIAAIAIALGSVWAHDQINPQQAFVVESVYDRVMRTGTIRCGYTPYSVGFIKDPNTGAFSGIYYDVVNELAKNLQLKVEYVEELGWGEQVAALESNRFDMMCSPTSLNAGRTRAADFSIPLYYSPVELWVRKDDSLAQAPLENFNKPEVKISVLDGEQTSTFARNYFPQAQPVSLPQSASFSELMLQVTMKKADVTLAEPFAVYEFMEANPDALQKVNLPKPLITVPNVILIKRDQFAFKEMIDNALRELFNTGFMDKAITKYEKYPNSYLRETTLR
ncbi:MAG: transporter substrate-binding domain-containing protein [Alphaproteobacteria bacterium]|nr:transporter substrate-binding domain-containing protein [Alphaproteobacteria bacterium]